jgi:hypothetical protein
LVADFLLACKPDRFFVYFVVVSLPDFHFAWLSLSLTAWLPACFFSCFRDFLVAWLPLLFTVYFPLWLVA